MKPAELPAEVFRLGRRPDPWAWPDWRYAAAAGTFNNRFDDPQGQFRVLYASTQRLAVFVECLAYFRPDPAIIAEYATIVSSEGDEEPPVVGVVPTEWVDARCVGTATITGDYVDLGDHQQPENSATPSPRVSYTTDCVTSTPPQSASRFGERSLRTSPATSSTRTSTVDAAGTGSPTAPNTVTTFRTGPSSSPAH